MRFYKKLKKKMQLRSSNNARSSPSGSRKMLRLKKTRDNSKYTDTI